MHLLWKWHIMPTDKWTSLDQNTVLQCVRRWWAVIWKIPPHEVYSVLNRARKSIKTSGHTLPTKTQLLVLLKESTVSLEEKCLHRGLNTVTPQRVLPYHHMASVLKEIMARGSRGQGSKLWGLSSSLQEVILLERLCINPEKADNKIFK